MRASTLGCWFLDRCGDRETEQLSVGRDTATTPSLDGCALLVVGGYKAVGETPWVGRGREERVLLSYVPRYRSGLGSALISGGSVGGSPQRLVSRADGGVGT